MPKWNDEKSTPVEDILRMKKEIEETGLQPMEWMPFEFPVERMWIANEVRDLQKVLKTTASDLLGKRMIEWREGVWVLSFLGHVVLAARRI